MSAYTVHMHLPRKPCGGVFLLTPALQLPAAACMQALEGGGAKNINFQELAADLAQITFDYPFRIPPYFALIIRAIGVLEGIALVGNPDFALVDEAYPYISKRLLTDPSPRLQVCLLQARWLQGQCYFPVWVLSSLLHDAGIRGLGCLVCCKRRVALQGSVVGIEAIGWDNEIGMEEVSLD